MQGGEGGSANLCRRSRRLACYLPLPQSLSFIVGPTKVARYRVLPTNTRQFPYLHFLRANRARRTTLRCRDPHAIPTCALAMIAARKHKWKKRIYIYSLALVEGGERGRKRERDDERDTLTRALWNGPVLMDSRTWYEVLPDFAWPAISYS